MALIKPLLALMFSVSMIQLYFWRKGESSNLLPKVHAKFTLDLARQFGLYSELTGTLCLFALPLF
jgi:hypothetical protein